MISAEMHGMIHDCLRLMVTRKFGNDIFDRIVSTAGCDDVKDFRIFDIHDDTVTMRLVAAASEVLGIEVNGVLEAFGEFFYHYAVERGFSEMLERLGPDLVTFLNGLDAHHHFLGTFIYGGMKSPSFVCEMVQDGNFLLHYYSTRPGLCPVAIGVIRECAKELFNVNISIVPVQTKQEILAGVLHTHVILRILEVDKHGTAVAQPGVLTSGGSRPNSTVPMFDAISCCPSSPLGTPDIDGLLLNKTDFNTVIPLHIIFDQETIIQSTGVYFYHHTPWIRTGSRLTDYFTLVYPKVALTWSNLKSLANSQYVLQACARDDVKDLQNRQTGKLMLKGQMFPLSNRKDMIYVATLCTATLSELRHENLYLSDIPFYDSTRDVISLNQLRSAELDLSKKLEETTAELQIVSRALQKEKLKTEALLNEMLPPSVADALKEGKDVAASSFDSVTILFGDIVNFTVLSSLNQPDRLVDMLNSLFTLFDQLSHWNGVYKVETIGDSYMVCSGVPIPATDHAECVSNMALGMVLVTSLVKSPVDNSLIQIRVGIHSGPVMAGVVGKRMPRYCLFGDTVNTASRMESHGVPGKIQMSSSTFDILDKTKYDTAKRGVVNVKGKGEMTTYFLRKHRYKTIEQLVGTISVLISDDTDAAAASTPANGKEKALCDSSQSSGGRDNDEVGCTKTRLCDIM